ncbi:MAG: hypothetical protein LAO21_02210 [Acidobacteriia bacterium]|nr:hypothetical protein [Terriglobia bacterium]
MSDGWIYYENLIADQRRRQIGGVVENVIEYKNEYHGRSYTCQYKIEYLQFRGCYTMTFVPDSLQWDDQEAPPLEM